MLFFYIDDIVILCAKRYLYVLQAFKEKLLRRFKIRALGELE